MKWLRNAQGLSRWWAGHECCEPPQVLCDGCKNELILGASWAAQPKPTEPEDALQVREPHLDFLRSRLDCSNASVPAKERAISRAASC